MDKPTPHPFAGPVPLAPLVVTVDTIHDRRQPSQRTLFAATFARDFDPVARGESTR
jgi:hypothetical protein